MKVLKDKQTELENTDGSKMWYSDLIILIISTPPQSGFKLKDMRTKFAILESVEKGARKKIELSSDHVKIIQDEVKSFAWAKLHKDIIAFSDEIESL